MKWRDTRRSQNVEVRGGGIGGPMQIGGLGLIVVLAVSLLLGVNPSDVLDMVPSGAGPSDPGTVSTPLPGTAGDFVSQVLADTEDTWTTIFRDDLQQAYTQPGLVIFDGAVQSACGLAQSAVGPFYCPADQKIYLDLKFFQDLERLGGTSGDFAQAYVIAHEVGHHIQRELGTMSQVDSARRGLSKSDSNDLSVRMELQADCYAGVWANRAQQLRLEIDQSDVSEGIAAAQAVGDDRLQTKTQGYVVPDSFTHGSAEQRAEWLTRGLEEGDLQACDTF